MLKHRMGGIGGMAFAAVWLVAGLMPAAASAQYVAPAQWAPMSELLLGCNDTYLVLDAYIDTVRGNHSKSPISVICASSYIANSLRYEFQSAGLDVSAVRYYTAAVDSIWMRDYGPMFTHDAAGKVYAVDANYYPDRPNDDQIPYKFARFRGLGYKRLSLSYEGGNFMTDGAGNFFFSNDTYAENYNVSKSTVNSRLKSALGGRNIYTPTPLRNEGTGHIDMYAKLLAARKVLVSDYPAGNVNKSRVDAAATLFANLGYTVVRQMMAVAHDPFATYANAVYTNGIAFVPVYGQPEDSAALAKYAAAGYEAAPVDCSLMIEYGGAIHCVTMPVPKPRTTS